MELPSRPFQISQMVCGDNGLCFRITSGSQTFFTARVIHSLPLRMSAIHVMQDSKIVALSHLIGSDQLPNSKSVVRKQPFFGAFLCLSLYSDRRSSGTHEVWVLNTGSDIAIAGLFARQ